MTSWFASLSSLLKKPELKIGDIVYYEINPADDIFPKYKSFNDKQEFTISNDTPPAPYPYIQFEGKMYGKVVRIKSETEAEVIFEMLKDFVGSGGGNKIVRKDLLTKVDGKEYNLYVLQITNNQSFYEKDNFLRDKKEEA